VLPHGAFKGGRVAGYNNTVGSAEGPFLVLITLHSDTNFQKKIKENKTKRKTSKSLLCC
jgi:hypothetical protein